MGSFIFGLVVGLLVMIFIAGSIMRVVVKKAAKDGKISKKQADMALNPGKAVRGADVKKQIKKQTGR